MKLYLYDDCPFFVKAQAIFSTKAIPFKLVTPPTDNAAMPVRMIARKMAPNLGNEVRFMPESHVGAIRREPERRHRKLICIGG